MKHKSRLFSLAAALLFVLAVLPDTALAAGTGSADPTFQAPPPAAVYPTEVRTSEENGMIRLERIYHLSARDDPAAIPTEDFDREGLHYTLLDVIRNDLSETDTKDYIEVVTLESETKDIGEIIKTLEPELEIATEDGYTGILKPDYANITVEAAGYRTSSWTVSATRTYPNLADADTSMIPKTIEDSGRTLTLADVDWQDASTDYVDGEALAMTYTAVASYTGTATGRSVTGYIVTVDYGGEVTKTSVDTVVYTAIFSAENTSHDETDLEPEPEPEETVPPEEEPLPEVTEAPDTQEQDESDSVTRKIVIMGLGAVVILAVVGLGGWQLCRYIRDKKRGYK